MTDALSISLLATVCLALVAAVFTAMLRAGGVGGVGMRAGAGPGGFGGTAIVGGIVAGLLAGPGVLGQVSPQLYQQAFVGAVDETNASNELRARQRADIAAMTHAGVTGIAIEELAASHQRELIPLNDAIAAAKQSRRAMFDAIAACFAGASLFAACACAMPRRRSAKKAMAHALRNNLTKIALSSGVLVLLGVGLPALVTYAFVDIDVRPIIAFALVVGMLGFSGALSPGLRWIAFGSALLGWLIAGAVAPTAMFAALSAAALAGCAVGFVQSRRVRAIFLGISRWAALPALGALLAVRIDVAALPAAPAFWFFLIGALLWCSDGRWFAARTAVRVAGIRKNAWSRATGLVNAGPGTLTLVLALLFTNAGIAGEVLIASALASAAVVELFRGFRSFAGPILDD